MNMAKRVLWLGLVVAALTATRANAVLISIDPASQDGLIGGDVFADIVISDLDDDESVGGVSLLLSFDDSILQGVSYTLDPDDVMGLEDDLSFGFSGGDGSPLDLFFLAEALTHELLHAMQGDGFVAATVQFLALANGTSPLNLSVVEPGGTFLSDADGFELAAAAANGAVCVGADCGSVTVPEPGTLSLLGAALLGVVAVRRRLSAAAAST
jgi:hypothetical protein